MTSLEHQHEETTHAPSDSWFARLIAFIAWLFGAEHKLKSIRATTRFKQDWRDRYAELLPVEWHRDQMLAQGAALLLAGKTLDDAEYVPIPMPADYGGPCPRTPFEIARRWLAVTKFLKDPEAHIIRHAQRIAKRAGAAHGSTDARFHRAAHHEAVAAATPQKHTSCLALMVSSTRSVRPSNHEGVLANARAPPAIPRLPTAHSQLPQALRA